MSTPSAIMSAIRDEGWKNLSKTTNYMPQIEQMGKDYSAPGSQVKDWAKSIMPAYQARLSGLNGPTSAAMRNNASFDIQSQYGNALRAAQQTAGNQGIRGPAAVAMQGDIRGQMGMAQAKFNRDLTVADWDIKRQALQDYYSVGATERGVQIGNLAALQGLRNVNTGFDKYGNALGGMYTDANKRGGGYGQGFNAALQPHTMLGLPSAPGMDDVSNMLSGYGQRN